MEKITGNTQTKSFKIIPVFIAVLLVLPTFSWAGKFKVVRVYDGDTLQAIGHGIEIMVRLVGIDAPERSTGKQKSEQPYSQHATEYLSTLVLGEIVEIKGHGLDSFNQILGVVQINGKNVNLEIVKEGLAEVYRGKLPETLNIKPYKQAEEEAKKAGLGIWSLGDKYISPRDWKRIQKK
jgi:micrococcal nuclease